MCMGGYMPNFTAIRAKLGAGVKAEQKARALRMFVRDGLFEAHKTIYQTATDVNWVESQDSTGRWFEALHFLRDGIWQVLDEETLAKGFTEQFLSDWPTDDDIAAFYAKEAVTVA